MQDFALSKWLAPLMAFCFTFVLVATLAPVTSITLDRQLDFWLLWILTLVVLALPIGYLEIALAKRSQGTALNALSKLTRDADASSRWRAVGWLAVCFMPFFAGAIISNLSILFHDLAISQSISSTFLMLGLMLMAVILAFVPRVILLFIMAIGVIATLIASSLLGHSQVWHWTPIVFSEWGSAVVLALVATGLGMGAYWQNSLSRIQADQSSSGIVFPIWAAQLVAVIVFGFYQIGGVWPVFSLMLASVFAAALLLQLAWSQLAERQVAIFIRVVIIAFGLLIWLLAFKNYLNVILMLWGLLVCLIYSVFAGWIMKISHLRKALNFQSELTYNLWRIAVRIILPASIIVAMVAVIGTLV